MNQLGIVQTHNPRTWEVDAGGSRGHPQLHDEFESNLDHMRPCLKMCYDHIIP